MRRKRIAWKRTVYHDARSIPMPGRRRRLEKFRERFVTLADRRLLPSAIAMLLFMLAAVLPPVRHHLNVPQEFPDLLYQGYIFGQNIFHGNDFGGAYAIHSYIPPGILSTLFIGAGSQFIDIFIVTSAFHLLSMMMMWSGVYLFMGIGLPRRNFLRSLIAFSFVFGYHFWLGDMNFSMGFGMALAGLYLLIARRWIDRPIAMSALLVLCYLGSFFAVISLVLGAVAWIIVERRYDLLRRLIPASLPALLLLVHYGYHVDLPAYFPADQAYTTLYRYWNERGLIVAGTLAPFMQRDGNLGLYGPNDLAVANMAYLVVVSGMVGLSFLRIGRNWSRPERFTLLLVMVSAVVVLAMPLQIAGILYPAQGFVLFFLVNIITLLLLRLPSSAVALTPFYLLLNIAIGWMTIGLLPGGGIRCFSSDSIGLNMPGHLNFFMHQDMIVLFWAEIHDPAAGKRSLPVPVHPSGIIRNLPPTEEYFKQWR